MALRRDLIGPSYSDESWDYDENWAARETDLGKLRSQITIMARQLREFDRIDRHNREVNEKLRAALGLAESGELEELVAQWLRRKGYKVRRPMTLLSDRSGRSRHPGK